MKKKLLAFACAMTMVLGMSLSVCAAPSSTASVTAQDVINKVTTPATTAPATSEELVKAEDNTIGQVITTNTISYFADTTTVEGVAGTTVKAVSADTAKNMIAQAKTIAGKNTFIASIVDLQVPAGTGKATFTLGCPNVWKGQNVTILHQKADGSYENIKPDKVEDNKVTFTMSSYSPVAIVINTGAASPKTGDIFAVVAAMAAISGCGAVACTRKKED